VCTSGSSAVLGPQPREMVLADIERARLGPLEPRETVLADIERARLGPLERVRVGEVVSNIALRVFFTVFVVAVFGWLNYQVMDLVRDIFEETKSLDHQIVLALIGGTVTQLGLITYMIAKFLFPGQGSGE